MIRKPVLAVLTGAIVLGAAWTGAAGAAPHVAAGRTVARPAGSGRPASLVPLATGVRLSSAALAAAADRCAAWASQAGLADNGYLAGSLTSAVAIALAESGCDPSACYDDTTGEPCAKHVPPTDSVDRGAWQINNGNRDISRTCAYSGSCSARAVYSKLSADGSYFAPWTTYLTDAYAGFRPAAQQAVNRLTAGTVTSGLTGTCLGYPDDAVQAAVTAGECGSGAADLQWTIQGAALRTSAGLCLSAPSWRHRGPAVLRDCDASPLQDWIAHPDAALYNPAARRCLNDPGAAAAPGAVIGDRACDGGRAQTWFKP
jgi:Lysozyme like domain/Ricin-type beta-trefoil lectin domain